MKALTAAGAAVVGPLGTWITNDALAHTMSTPSTYAPAQGDFTAGYSNMAVDGGYGVVGCYTEDSAAGGESGAVHIFNMSTGSLYRSVVNPNTSTGQQDLFGQSVDYDHSYGRVIIGAPGTDIGGVYTSGKVYLYSPGTNSIIKTTNNPTSTNDAFGQAVAIDGNWMAVAASNARTPAGESSGGLIYLYNGSNMAYQRTIQNPNHYGGAANARDQLSRIMKMSNGRLIVSGFQEDDASGTNSGVVYVFNLNGALLNTYVNPNPYSTGAGDSFGYSLDVYQDTMIVGAPYEDQPAEGDDTGINTGRAYIYNLSTGTLTHTLVNPNHYGAAVNDNLGKRVSIAESKVFVSATGEDDATGNNVGIVYAFDAVTGDHVGTLENPNDFGTTDGDSFGTSIASDGDHLLAAATGEDSASLTNVQRFYIFDLPE